MYSSEVRIRVRYGETDAMGYLYHGNYSLYYEVGRTDMIRTLGLTYKELEASGIIMPVAEHYIKYIRPALYDDLLTVKTILKEMPEGKRITFHTEIYNENKKLLNTGYTILAFVTVSTGKTTTLPKILTDKLSPVFS